MAKKKREALVIASKVNAYVEEIDRRVSTALRDIQTLGRRFPGNGDIQRAAWLGREDLTLAYKQFKDVENVIHSCGRYLTNV